MSPKQAATAEATPLPIPRSRVTVVTPAMAEKWLTNLYPKQRFVQQAMVDFLCRVIEGGQWTITNDAICFTPSGQLLNGQHRCLSIVKTGVSVQALIVENMTDEAFHNMDTARPRDMAFRTGLQSDLVADVNLLFRIKHATSMRHTAKETADFADSWRPAYEKLSEAAGGLPRTAGNATYVRVAVGLRWATLNHDADRDYVLQQYGHLIRSDVEQASKAVRVFWRRQTERRKFWSGGSGRMEGLAAAWVHFDPQRAQVEPLVRSLPEVMDEVRQWVRMLPDAFALGPDRRGHVYAWPGAPRVERKVAGAAAVRQEAARQRRLA